MPRSCCEWKRYWCPLGASIRLTEEGFLADPEGPYGKLLNPNLISYAEIEDSPCVAMLGDPGLGKSTVLSELARSAGYRTEGCGSQRLHLNLSGYAEESRLIRDLFESVAPPAAVQEGQRLDVFLDSLDECQLLMPNVSSVLLDGFTRIKDRGCLPAVRLRIACRTLDWPQSLQEGLSSIWGAGAFRAVELAPLRRSDVVLAADSRSVNSETFIRRLCEAGVVAFAVRPVTLFMLLDLSSDTMGLPQNRAELYERGCRKLCEEVNTVRRERRKVGGTGRLSVDERMDVAGQLAAISLLCERSTFVAAPESAIPESGSVAVSTLVTKDDGSGSRAPLNEDGILVCCHSNELT